jgi:hypothetical protein
LCLDRLNGCRFLFGEAHLVSGLHLAILALHLPPGKENEDDQEAENQNRCKYGKTDSAAQTRRVVLCAPNGRRTALARCRKSRRRLQAR